MREFKPCLFYGKDDIGVKETIIEHKMGQGAQCSAVKRVWAYCRYCYAEGKKTTVDVVYDDEVIAAMVAWNEREGGEQE